MYPALEDRRRCHFPLWHNTVPVAVSSGHPQECRSLIRGVSRGSVGALLSGGTQASWVSLKGGVPSCPKEDPGGSRSLSHPGNTLGSTGGGDWVQGSLGVSAGSAVPETRLQRGSRGLRQVEQRDWNHRPFNGWKTTGQRGARIRSKTWGLFVTTQFSLQSGFS